MSHYNDEHPNRDNRNNFDEGITDRSIANPGMTYQVNSMSPAYMPHGYSLSLACKSGTDMAHTVGNVTAIMLQYVLDLFPSKTFATALPSTRIASRQLRHTPKQIRTQPYPICVVTPRVSLTGLDNRLAAGSFGTSYWGPVSNRFQNRSEMPILFFDKRKGIEWRGKLNRVVVYLDFVLAFRSAMEQLRWASYLINSTFAEGGFFDVDTAMELAIPDGFLNETAKYAGIPVKDQSGSVADFVDYLNTNSEFPISYRFSSGRHTDAFYAYYMTSILCSMHDLSYNSVSKVGQTESDCPITFTLRCEFNTVGMFDLSVPNPGPYRELQPAQGAVSIPIFSDRFSEKDFPLLPGWKIIARPIAKFDWGEKEIDISSVFSQSIRKLIEFHLENHINPELFVNVALRENHTLLQDGFYVDWKRLTLVIQNVDFENTYRLIITLNQLYVNNQLKALYEKDSKF